MSATDQTPLANVGLMKGKRGLVLGIANANSAAYSIAQQIVAQGGEVAISYQNEGMLKRVKPLADELGAELLLECDVEHEASMDSMFATLKETWGELDFVVHSLAYADRNELKGQYVDTSRENFQRAMLISCFSLTEIAQRAEPLMKAGGSMITLTFIGSRRTLPAYNVMGVAKAGLEASVRYLAGDLGPKGIRINAVSPGPLKTISGAAISTGRRIYSESADLAPLGRNATTDEVGRVGLYFLSDLSSGVTGCVHSVDGGFHSVGLGKEKA
ncbi:MAG: enoyl-ACP reductase FabI [Alphaproteobacteria bacterium]